MKRYLSIIMLFIFLVTLISGCSKQEEGKIKDIPKMVLLTITDDEQRLHAQAFQEMWRNNLGIDVNIESADQVAYMERLKNGEFSFYYIGWSADYRDPQAFLEMWTSKNPSNFSGWKNEEYDNYLEKSKIASGEERYKMLAAAETILLNDMPVIPLYWPSRTFLLKKGVENLIPRDIGAVNEYKWCSTMDGYMRLNIPSEPPVLDPQKSYDIASLEILNSIFEGLVRLDSKGHILPGNGLAKKWEVSEDGLRYTFYLRESFWSDGTPLTAEDFIYAWKRAIDPSTGSPSAHKFFNIKGAYEYNQKNEDPNDKTVEQEFDGLGLTAPDSHTLVIDLSNPVPYFLELIADPAFFPVTHHLDNSGGPIPASPEKTVSNGPFIIKEWLSGNKIVIEKNNYYWDNSTVNLNEIHFLIIPDPGAVIAEFEREELDLALIPGTLVTEYANTPELHTFTEAAVYFLGINTGDEFLDNAALRHALSMALNRQEFINNVLTDGSVAATSFTPPAILADNETFSSLVGECISPISDDTAKELLEKGLAELNY